MKNLNKIFLDHLITIKKIKIAHIESTNLKN